MRKYIKNYVILCIVIGMLVKIITIYLNNGFIVERKILNAFLDTGEEDSHLKSLVTQCTKLYVYALVANPGDAAYNEASIILLKKLTPPTLFDNAILFKADHYLKSKHGTIEVLNFNLLDLKIESLGYFSTVASWVESENEINKSFIGAFNVNLNESVKESDINCLITNFVIESVNRSKNE